MFENILQSFVRNIVPGFVFSVFCFVIPAKIIEYEPLDQFLQFEILVITGVVAGFVLDGFGAYRYTPKFLTYRALKVALIEKLNSVGGNFSSSMNPDMYLADVWASNKDLYDRLFEERAEWVSILSSSFSFLCASFVGLAIFLKFVFLASYPEIPIAAAYTLMCLLVSTQMAATGIGRMKAHNDKFVKAVEITQK